jgi:hypothetical protein
MVISKVDISKVNDGDECQNDRDNERDILGCREFSHVVPPLEPCDGLKGQFSFSARYSD